ncbi:hypothetical protein KEC56_13635 [Microbacterium sp. YMB-B2]|uniref:Uncharacterized protein n=2 Tax=Microbacterium TaxID=33882 RepID=A0A9X1S0F2_9MICO|nr:hypothetical protein [Microbacterium tenebrionis]MCC2030536.1 hypothetical protein [Microbacterium tenebrionis]
MVTSLTVRQAKVKDHQGLIMNIILSLAVIVLLAFGVASTVHMERSSDELPSTAAQSSIVSADRGLLASNDAAPEAVGGAALCLAGALFSFVMLWRILTGPTLIGCTRGRGRELMRDMTQFSRSTRFRGLRPSLTQLALSRT